MNKVEQRLIFERLPHADDRPRIRESEPILLTLEDDEVARILEDMVGESAFKAVVAMRDAGIAMASESRPGAITLDVQLPVIDGHVWTH